MAATTLGLNLYDAASVGDLEEIKSALANGADIDWKNPDDVDNWTPLHKAAFNNNVEAVQLLIRSNAKVDSRDRDGWTPLMLAAANGLKSAQSLIFLLDSGADVTAFNNNGKTALDYARGDILLLLKVHSDFHFGLNDGYVSLDFRKLILIGPPNVGKTAFQSLLFNFPAPKCHHSTTVGSRPVRAVERIADTAEGKVWDVVEAKDILKMLTDAISDITSEDQATTVSFDASPLELAQSQSSYMSQGEESSFSRPVDYTEPDDVDTAKDKPAFNLIQQEQTKKILHLLEEKKKSKEGKKSKELHKATWVHVLDSGGQPQFADIAKAFIRGNTVNIIFVKLTEKLSDKPSFVYSLNGTAVNAPTELQMTNLQLIEHFVHSVAASRNTCTVSIDGKQILTKPVFVFIGTYYDKATKGFINKTEITSELISDKNEQILTSLEEFRDHFIFYNKSSNDLIFPVDNLCVINRKKISAEIRNRIMSQEGIGFQVPIPIRWYFFEILMRDKSYSDHGIVSIESCYNIGATLKMSKKEVKSSLIYFDSFTMCFYFEKVLPNLIFTNPQYLFDILSGLVRASFVSDLQVILPKGKFLSPDAQQLLKKNGIFEDSILDVLGLPFVESLFTKRDFLFLLQSLFVVSPIKSFESIRQSFFIPIVLPPKRITEEQKKSFTATCDPLIITFNSKLVLQGLFPTLIVSLLSRKENPYFFLDSHSRNFSQQLRYAVCLYSEDLFGSIILCDNLKSIEVYFTGLSKHCFLLREVVLNGLSESADVLSYDIDTLKISALVRCNQKHTLIANDTDPHPITISYKETPPVIGCSIEILPAMLLSNKKQSCWLIDSSNSSVPHSNEQLSLEETAPITVFSGNTILPEKTILNQSHAPLVLKTIRNIVEEWENLGLYLGIENQDLKAIKYNCQNQVEVCKKDLICHWIRLGFASREALILALENVEKYDIVAEVQNLPKQ